MTEPDQKPDQMKNPSTADQPYQPEICRPQDPAACQSQSGRPQEPDQIKKPSKAYQPKSCRTQYWRRAAAVLLRNLQDAWPWMRKSEALARRRELRDVYEKRLARGNDALEKHARELVRLQQVIDHHLHPLLELDRLYQDRTQLIIRCTFAASWFARLGQLSQERLGQLSPAQKVGLDWYTASAARKYQRFLKQVLEAPAPATPGSVEEIPVLNVDDQNEK